MSARCRRRPVTPRRRHQVAEATAVTRVQTWPTAPVEVWSGRAELTPELLAALDTWDGPALLVRLDQGSTR